jgi:hypothetical protein
VRRTQILLDPVMYRRAVDEARARRSSLGEVHTAFGFDSDFVAAGFQLYR